jgi:hypothetical protein
MTQPSEWTTTEEKVTEIVTSWRMLVHEQNQPGRRPGPTDYINALETLPKEERSEILLWFNPSHKTLNDLNVEIVRLTDANRLLCDDVEKLRLRLEGCRAVISRFEEDERKRDNHRDATERLQMAAGDAGMISALPDHTEVSVYTPSGEFVRRSFTHGAPYKVVNGTWVVGVMNRDGNGSAPYNCRDLAKVVR